MMFSQSFTIIVQTPDYQTEKPFKEKRETEIKFQKKPIR